MPASTCEGSTVPGSILAGTRGRRSSSSAGGWDIGTCTSGRAAPLPSGDWRVGGPERRLPIPGIGGPNPDTQSRVDHSTQQRLLLAAVPGSARDFRCQAHERSCAVVGPLMTLAEVNGLWVTVPASGTGDLDVGIVNLYRSHLYRLNLGDVIAGFIGRESELSLLRKRLDRVAATGAGTAMAIRGRRQVGKSRLVQEFCDRAAVPYLFSTATKGASPVEAVTSFLADLRESALPGDRQLLVPQDSVGNWPDAFRVLASVLPDAPCVVVLDELPWLAEQDALFDGALQTAWDRLLAPQPVLLLLLGSDLHMMTRFTRHDQPFFGRADTLELGPLTLADTGDALGLAAADAIDAHLVSGGLPGIL